MNSRISIVTVTMIRLWAATLLAVGIMFLCACGPKPAPAPSTPLPSKPSKPYPAPSELEARVFYHRINLTWKTNRSDSTMISGYNIYLWNEKEAADTSLASFKKVNLEPYPGDMNPDIARESFALEGLENGVIYRAYVTTLFPNGIESARSNIVEAIPRPEGWFTLRESFRGDESGYSFRKTKSVSTDDLSNDIYLATINGSLYVASPRRINVVFRATKFYGMIIYSQLDDVAPTTVPPKADNALEVYNGQVFMLQDQDSCYAVLKFDAVDVKGKTVQISYIYQPRPSTLVFH